VAKLVNKTLERFHVPTSVEVVLDLPDNLPDVFADPRQVEQILGNLVVNACQAMGAGGKLTISAKEKMEIVAIAVKDTGTGITREDLNKIFEPLFSTKAKGIGLGLAVSRKLAGANSGRIEVESELGKGSTFTLYVPVSSQEKTRPNAKYPVTKSVPH
jgi:signal transduction histidine kinase